MVDQNALARNCVGWFGERLAAEAMGITEEKIKELTAVRPAVPKVQPQMEAAEEQAALFVNEKPAEKQAPTEPAPGKKTRPTYTPEQKAEAVRLVAEIGLTKASRQTGVSVASLMKWRQNPPSLA